VEFPLFILVTGILIVRPTDFIPGLEGLQLYLVFISILLFISWGKLLPQLSPAYLQRQPVTFCVLGVLFSTVFSCVLNGNLGTLVGFVPEFIKVILLYLLIVGVVDTPARLRYLMSSLVVMILIPTILAVLTYHGVLNLAAFEPLPDSDSFRLRGSGNFQDPNDVCEILNIGILFGAFGVLEARKVLTRLLPIAPILFFLYALHLTHSRGGMIGTLAGAGVLFHSRFGLKRSILLAALLVPLGLAFFGGRQTTFDASEGTAQSRIQIWHSAFELMRRSPIIGVSLSKLNDETNHAAHNSFVSAYCEIGMIGGAFYFGLYYHAFRLLKRLGNVDVTIPDPEIRRVRPYIMAALASYGASEISLTHDFGVTTYLVLGICSACIGLANPSPLLSESRVDGKLAARTLLFSTLFLAALWIYTQKNAQ
jgi:putative inorganic carbon (hco3(-)) transporter